MRTNYSVLVQFPINEIYANGDQPFHHLCVESHFYSDLEEATTHAEDVKKRYPDAHVSIIDERIERKVIDVLLE